jgi:hypothetical protein
MRSKTHGSCAAARLALAIWPAADYSRAVSEPSDLPLSTRLWFAWVCLFHVLFDGAFAGRVWNAREMALLPPGQAKRALGPAPDAEDEPEEEPEPAPRAVAKAVAKPAEPPPVTPALQLLALFQREGRLVDFLQQDIAEFDDGDVAAAARVVHEGCRKALRDHLQLAPVRTEEEGSPVTLAEGFSPAEIKLTGEVRGSAPYKGVLRHRGWRAKKLELPTAMQGHDATVLAPAEVEL